MDRLDTGRAALAELGVLGLVNEVLGSKVGGWMMHCLQVRRTGTRWCHSAHGTYLAPEHEGLQLFSLMMYSMCVCGDTDVCAGLA